MKKMALVHTGTHVMEQRVGKVLEFEFYYYTQVSIWCEYHQVGPRKYSTRQKDILSDERLSSFALDYIGWIISSGNTVDTRTYIVVFSLNPREIFGYLAKTVEESMEAGTKRTGTTVQRHCTNTFIKINLPETPSFSAILFHCCAVTVLSLCCLCDASQIQGVIETSVIRVSISIFPERFKWEKVTVNPPRFGPRLLALLPALVRVQYGHIKTSRLGSPAPARRQWGRGIHNRETKICHLSKI